MYRVAAEEDVLILGTKLEDLVEDQREPLGRMLQSLKFKRSNLMKLINLLNLMKYGSVGVENYF